MVYLCADHFDDAKVHKYSPVYREIKQTWNSFLAVSTEQRNGNTLLGRDLKLLKQPPQPFANLF